LRFLGCAVVLATAGTALLQGREAGKPTPPASSASSALRITSSSAGPVRLGMTVAEARKALPKHRISRTTDGEGLALIEVKKGDTVEMVLYAGEENPDKPIAEKAKVEAVSVYGPAYATAEGVHPGMTLREVEKRYGKLTSITMSEIEAREYADFARKPAGLQLRVGLPEIGIAGKYAEGKRETKAYAPSAVVTSIEINKYSANP
jgi:hypothetical protein